jgi:hypothetical protein
VIYTRSSERKPGVCYRNPERFIGPIRAATRVVLDGDYPNIAKAYEAIGVSVSKPAQAPQAEPEAKAQPEPEQPADDERDALAAEYEDRFGSKPHHKMKAETIREKLAEADEE